KNSMNVQKMHLKNQGVKFVMKWYFQVNKKSGLFQNEISLFHRRMYICRVNKSLEKGVQVLLFN
ncbi:hypothetical protein ACT4US_32680, partial [Bacillus sp. HC-Mk]